MSWPSDPCSGNRVSAHCAVSWRLAVTGRDTPMDAGPVPSGGRPLPVNDGVRLTALKRPFAACRRLRESDPSDLDGAQRHGRLLVQPAGCGSVFVGVSHDQIGVEPPHWMSGRWALAGHISLSLRFRLKYTAEVHQGVRCFKKPAFLDVPVICQRVSPSPPLRSCLKGQKLWNLKPLR
jgi:hypothetical protein